MTLPDATPQQLYLMQLSAATVPIAPGRSLATVNVCDLVAMSDGTHILNEEQLRASTQKPVDLATREQAVRVVFGHDGEQ